jgi:hypothetical protein
VLLPEPYEFVDLSHLTSMMLQVASWLDGSVIIHPRNPTPRHVRIMMDQRALTAPPLPGEPISVEVPAIRLIGVRTDEPSSARYWDVSSKTLRADLLARFGSTQTFPMTLKLTANGHAPKKRYSVEVW